MFLCLTSRLSAHKMFCVYTKVGLVQTTALEQFAALLHIARCGYSEICVITDTYRYLFGTSKGEVRRTRRKRNEM